MAKKQQERQKKKEKTGGKSNNAIQQCLPCSKEKHEEGGGVTQEITSEKFREVGEGPNQLNSGAGFGRGREKKNTVVTPPDTTPRGQRRGQGEHKG